MTDNLIERLRSNYIGTTSTPKWMNEAADEIERLRAENDMLKQHWDAERNGFQNAIAAEREACAKVADEFAEELGPIPNTSKAIATAIRARKDD